MRRRRIARLLDRFSLFVFGPYVDAWEAWPEERINAKIDAVEREAGQSANIVRPG